MSMDMLIDFVWSMSAVDLIPNYWLLADLIKRVNESSNYAELQALSFIHKARLWEIFQAVYANRTCHESLNLVNMEIMDELHAFYDESIVTHFNQHCKLRPSLVKFCKVLADEQIQYEIGCAVGNMLALCDIVIPQYKICVEVFDFPHIARRWQNKPREWIKLKARREITRRLIENTHKDWHFVIVDGVDPQYDLDRFAGLIKKFVAAHRLKRQLNETNTVYINREKDVTLDVGTPPLQTVW
eukprot:CAMPEP_0197079744 /NCGR_PEP_ID=MMETSP1384-20130603/213780_1 /TAXON_ID=29189 /ORGANISM="Ammonia sp." /LENGTH=241 /DNA_ID=CAMNT_0042518623 /DNA_START=18 /DNA_END=740 /DNA_ORIENTATION=+